MCISLYSHLSSKDAPHDLLQNKRLETSWGGLWLELWPFLYFPNRSLLLRVIMTHQKRGPERHTGVSGLRGRPAQNRSGTFVENHFKFKKRSGNQMQRTNAPETQFSLVNDTSAAPNVRETNCKYENVREIKCKRKIAAVRGEMCVLTPFSCCLFVVCCLSTGKTKDRLRR